MLNEAVAPSLSNEDRKTRINSLLRQVDSEIKSGNIDNALSLTQQVFAYDKNNLYARAFEERILALRSSKEQAKAQNKVPAITNERVEVDGKHNLKEISKNQEKAEKHLHIVELPIDHTEKHSKELTEKDPSTIFQKESAVASDDKTELTEDIEQQLMQRINHVLESKQHEIEETLQRQFHNLNATAKVTPESPTSSSLQQAHANTAPASLTMKEQQEEMKNWLLKERNRILDEVTRQVKEEQERFQENLAEYYKSTYEKKLEEEANKAHQQALIAYRSTLATLLQYKLPKIVQQAITRTMRTPLLITDSEHEQYEHQVHIDLYTQALLDTFTKETITPQDVEMLAKQRVMYGVSDDEHKRLAKKVKRELGLPDDTAVIFVVDDDPVVLTYTAHILKQSYPNVFTAESATAAAQLFEQQTPNLIISDVNMPGMGGFAFYENLLHGIYGDAVRSVPFVFASSLGDQFIINGAKQLGAKAYLVKPVSKETLESTVKEALL